MKIDAWMPLFGDDFSSAVRMFPKHIKWIYLDCLWHYWSHTHCSGLPNDDVLLELCSCDLQDWVRVKGLIFDDDRFFVLQDGKWHQMRCQEEYKKAGGISESRSESGKKGAAARWQTDGKPMANDTTKTLQTDAQPQPQPQETATPTTNTHIQPEARAEIENKQDPPLVRLMTSLNTAYQRNPKQVWNYADEQAAVDAIKRDGWESELELIFKHRRKLSPDDRKFYAPSVFSCLSKFDEWLDKARAQKIAPIKSSPPPPHRGKLQDADTLKKMAGQLAAHRKELR